MQVFRDAINKARDKEREEARIARAEERAAELAKKTPYEEEMELD